MLFCPRGLTCEHDGLSALDSRGDDIALVHRQHRDAVRAQKLDVAQGRRRRARAYGTHVTRSMICYI